MLTRAKRTSLMSSASATNKKKCFIPLTRQLVSEPPKLRFKWNFRIWEKEWMLTINGSGTGARSIKLFLCQQIISYHSKLEFLSLSVTSTLI
jgi:hypothetical protein